MGSPEQLSELVNAKTSIYSPGSFEFLGFLNQKDELRFKALEPVAFKNQIQLHVRM